MDAAFPVFLFLACLIGLLAFVARGLLARNNESERRAQSRSLDLAALASRSGWSFSPTDDGEIRGLPIGNLADDRTIVRNVIAIPAATPVWLFDEVQAYRQRDGEFWATATCALFTIDANCPPLRIARGGELASSPGGADTEFEPFNATYSVWTKDERLKAAFVDGAMIEFLLTAPKWIDSIDVVNRYVMVRAEESHVEQWAVLAEFVCELQRRVPNAVSAFYGVE